jgi:peptidoglycan L-alanyl-D-glutamate endopeptidase CwlK
MVTLSKTQAAAQVARLRTVRGDLAAAYGVALGRWMGDRVLMALGQPIVTCGHRSAAEQTALFAQGRQPLAELNQLRKLAGLPAFPAGSAEAKRVVTWVTTSRHMELPSGALDVALLQADGSVTWDAGALEKFARLMKAADARVRWGGDWDGDGDTADEKSPDRPHFEVPR